MNFWTGPIPSHPTRGELNLIEAQIAQNKQRIAEIEERAALLEKSVSLRASANMGPPIRCIDMSNTDAYREAELEEITRQIEEIESGQS